MGETEKRETDVGKNRGESTMYIEHGKEAVNNLPQTEQASKKGTKTLNTPFHPVNSKPKKKQTQKLITSFISPLKPRSHARLRCS